MSIKITFPDGSKKEFDKGITGLDIANSISEGLGRAALAIEVNNKIKDIEKPIEKDASIRIITFKDDKGKEIFHHSTAHVMAAAVKKLYPKSKFWVGPSVEEGFYYDIDVDNLSSDDFEKIEAEMKKIVKEKLPFERQEITKKQAQEMFKDDEYKLELIKELPAKEKITTYKLGDFIDLCRGPHVPNAGKIKAFKLTKLAGAYWKADSNNKMLTRIYGISFPDKKELKHHLYMLEEAKKRDHKLIGKQLNLFSFHEEGPGFPFFHPKGTFIWNTLINFMRKEMIKRDYQENRTPIILNKALWLRSGHWDHYKENMYYTKIDNKDYAVKPMNCPGNLLLYKTHLHSYKELPIRAGEFGLVHRHEMSGVLNGLFRVRYFTQDDAHVFCTEEQLQDEIIALIEFIDYIYKTFGFEYNVELSTKPEKAIGSQEIWDKAESALKAALEKKKMDYKLNPGDGAFYGPKIDYHLKDSIGRTWQCGTIQLDFSMPEKFELEYDGKDGKKHRPVMLHRAIYGSIERFLGMLIEHYAGKFPMWLSPLQVKILTVADRFNHYAKEVAKKYKQAGIRVEIDDRSETINKKVRDAQLQKVNYILVVGQKEIDDNTVTVRTRDNEVLGPKKVDTFLKRMLKEVEDKR